MNGKVFMKLFDETQAGRRWRDGVEALKLVEMLCVVGIHGELKV